MQTVIEDVKSLELHPILCGFNVIISGAIVDETRQGRPHIGQTKKKKKNGGGRRRRRHTTLVASPSITTKLDSRTTSGDFVKYTANTNRKTACAWIRSFDDKRGIFLRIERESGKRK